MASPASRRTQIGNLVNANDGADFRLAGQSDQSVLSDQRAGISALAGTGRQGSSAPTCCAQNSALPLQLTLSNDAVYPHQGRSFSRTAR